MIFSGEQNKTSRIEAKRTMTCQAGGGNHFKKTQHGMCLEVSNSSRLHKPIQPQESQFLSTGPKYLSNNISSYYTIKPKWYYKAIRSLTEFIANMIAHVGRSITNVHVVVTPYTFLKIKLNNICTNLKHNTIEYEACLSVYGITWEFYVFTMYTEATNFIVSCGICNTS